MAGGCRVSSGIMHHSFGYNAQFCSSVVHRHGITLSREWVDP